MKYDVWVHLRTMTGWKSQYYGEVEADPGDIVDALRVLFGKDMLGAHIEPAGLTQDEEEDSD